MLFNLLEPSCWSFVSRRKVVDLLKLTWKVNELFSSLVNICKWSDRVSGCCLPWISLAWAPFPLFPHFYFNTPKNSICLQRILHLSCLLSCILIQLLNWRSVESIVVCNWSILRRVLLHDPYIEYKSLVLNWKR